MTPSPSQHDSALGTAQRALLKRHLSGAADQESGRIRPRAGDRSWAPLSYAQQRLWFLEQLTPGTSTYSVAAGVRLQGAVEVETLARSLTEVVRRHESLRTRFMLVDAEPRQVIDPPQPVTLVVEVVANEAAARTVAQAEAQTPFDLARGPLYRLRLLRWDETHVLLVTMHHIITDQWSLGILIDEVQRLYAADSAGAPSPLPALAIQYGDYAAWQRVWLQGPVLDAQLDYCRERLRDLTTIALPLDYPRPAMASSRGSRERFQLGETLTAEVRAASQAAGTTVFMTLLASFQAVLARWSGQDDIVVGVPVAGRTRVELEPLIGFFVNTLVLRTRVDERASFTDLLAHVREVTVGAYAHQDVPFERLVEELRPQRDLSRNPLFQVAFSFQNAPAATMTLADAEIEEFETHSGTTPFDLTVFVSDKQTDVIGEIAYRTDLFQATTIARLIDHWRHFLQRALAQPERAIGTVPLWSAAEQDRVATWGQGARARPRSTSLVEALWARAASTPFRPAVACDGDTVTCGDLIARADAMAAELRLRGVQRETRVGISTTRSISLVVGILAILRAGGAYVPLDPTDPRERLAGITRHVGLAAMVTSRHQAAAWSWLGVPIVTEDAGVRDRDGRGVPSGHTWATASDDELAYVMHTSGSTGRPKGVSISRAALYNVLESVGDRIGIGPDDVWLAVTRLAFDMGTLEVLLPLLAGARLIVAPEETVRDPAQLAATIEQQGVTMMQATPALWRMLVENGWRGSPRLHALSGGEALDADLARQLIERTASVWNLYGPTETAIYACGGRVGPDDAADVAIGEAVAETRLVVVDRQHQAVGIGVAGELWVGGEGLARGYHGEPAMTAERFLPDPWSPVPGRRVYRTGDRVRWREGGRLAYEGRLDRQVKIRGFRIEVSEIEIALRAHDGLRDAVVEARSGNADAVPRLVAYVVPAPGADAVDPGDLNRHLRQRLPDYMVPAQYVLVASLPVTANGKLDRRALPDPSDAATLERADHVAPRTAMEATLAGVWSDVLKVPGVGIRDNFFDIGGHSLLILQLKRALEETLQRPIPLIDLVRYATIELFALNLTQTVTPVHAPVSLRDRAERRRASLSRSTRSPRVTRPRD